MGVHVGMGRGEGGRCRPPDPKPTAGVFSAIQPQGLGIFEVNIETGRVCWPRGAHLARFLSVGELESPPPDCGDAEISPDTAGPVLD